MTLTNARRASAGEGAPGLLATGVATATIVSFLRVIAIVAVTQPVLLTLIAPALGAAVLAATVYTALALYRLGDGKSAPSAPAEFSNPFGFWQVVGFAIFLGAVIVIGRALGESFGLRGALLAAVGVGLADVDSITISMARLVPQPLGVLGASEAILAAVASNMFAKLAIAAVIGRGRFAVETAGFTAACWLAALAALWVTLTLGAG